MIEYESLTNAMLDALDAHDRIQNPNDEPLIIRDMISNQTLTIARCDELTDIALLHLDLDDELHELALIAIFDRDTHDIESLILNADSTIAILK